MPQSKLEWEGLSHPVYYSSALRARGVEVAGLLPPIESEHCYVFSGLVLPVQTAVPLIAETHYCSPFLPARDPHTPAGPHYTPGHRLRQMRTLTESFKQGMPRDKLPSHPSSQCL